MAAGTDSQKEIRLKGRYQIATAVITGLFTLTAAFVGGYFTGVVPQDRNDNSIKVEQALQREMSVLTDSLRETQSELRAAESSNHFEKALQRYREDPLMCENALVQKRNHKLSSLKSLRATAKQRGLLEAYANYFAEEERLLKETYLSCIRQADIVVEPNS